MGFQSVNKLLERSFRENWDREALSNYQGQTLTYGELATRISCLHWAFEHVGLVRGDKVALCAKNQANWAVCFLASMTYGAVPVPILHEFKPENVHYLVNHSEAKALFVDEGIWENLSENEMPGVGVVIKMNTMQCLYAKAELPDGIPESLDEGVKQLYPDGMSPAALSYYEDRPEELAMINYTSGTSGFSKGVMIPYRALWANIRFAGETAEPQMDCNSKVVAMLPSAHMYGLMFEFLFEMTIGAHVYFLTRLPSPKIILKAFQDIHPDIIISVPLIIEKVYKSQVKPVADKNKTYMRLPFLGPQIGKKFRNSLMEAFGGCFAEIILGGAPFNPEAEEFLRKIHFPFTVGYGMTECSPLVTYAKWNETKSGSCGKPITDCRIRIDSANPYKIPGEIQIKGPNVFLGYYKNRKATNDSFTNDDWFKTGDMGIIDKDGYLYLRGRSKCMILGPSGQNIYPEELEAVINNVNYIIDSLVVEDAGGLTALVYPDYKQGEIDGIERLDLEEKLLSCLPEINRSLPSYAQIRKMEFMPEDFERTPKKSIKRYLYKRG